LRAGQGGKQYVRALRRTARGGPPYALRLYVSGPGPVEQDGAADDGAAVHGGADVERAAGDACAVVHDADAHAPVVVGAGGRGDGAAVDLGRRAVRPPGPERLREADPVVVDAEADLLLPHRERDVDAARAAVPDGVADGLLRDPEEVGGMGHRGDPRVRARRIGRARDPEEALGGRREAGERGGQPVGLQLDRDEPARQPARVLVGLFDELRDLVGLLGPGRAVGVEAAGEPARDEPDPGELLPEAVVQVLPDAAALLLRDPEHLELQAAALRDVADDPGEDRPPLHLDLAHG